MLLYAPQPIGYDWCSTLNVYHLHDLQKWLIIVNDHDTSHGVRLGSPLAGFFLGVAQFLTLRARKRVRSLLCLTRYSS
jgi:hypothetical protein